MKAEQSAPVPLSYDNSLEGDEGITNAVRGYNKAVIDANMQARNMGKIAAYATTNASYRAISFIEEKRKKGVVMRSKLSRLYFEDITISDEKNAVATTKEVWFFDYVDLEGKLEQSAKEMVYSLSYKLVKSKRGWIVDEISQLLPPVIKDINPPQSIYK